jgi:hypothetical protein
MKNNHLSNIITCLAFLFLMPSCDTGEIHKSGPKADLLIEPRNIEDCEDCPVDDCCCAIALIEGANLSIDLCGTSTPNKPSTLCNSTVGSCNISGFIFTLPLLTSSDPLQYFCMPTNGSFYLRSMGSGIVRVTCQAGQVGYQSIDVNLPATRGFTVNGDCELTGC